MASSLRTKLRIASSVLLAPGFFDAIMGRWLFQPAPHSYASAAPEDAERWQDLAGAIHVHSTYSDGASDIPTVMEAAREAEVDFLLLTDHNTQRPLRDGWEARYETRPLLLIGTEVTVEHGAFLLALEMHPEWEPTRDLVPQDAVDEINAGGGLPLVSLPFDVKHPWRDWQAGGYRGLEVINFSTIARRHINLLSLIWLLSIWRFKGMDAVLRAIATRPDEEIAVWDRLSSDSGPMIGLAALDAHALMKIGRKKYPIPSYVETFRAVTTHVLIPPDSTNVRADIYAAMRAGRCYMNYRCFGRPEEFRFEAAGRTGRAEMGEKLSQEGEVRLSARLRLRETDRSARILLRLVRNGRFVAASISGSLDYDTAEPGVYRIEAYRYRYRVGPVFMGVRPWVFSNAIHVEKR